MLGKMDRISVTRIGKLSRKINRMILVRMLPRVMCNIPRPLKSF